MVAGEEATFPLARQETITLRAETTTPRRRTLLATYVRQRTPPVELPPARRKRLKAESSARSRALCRLNPEKHTQYLLAERKRKQDAAPTLASAATRPQQRRCVTSLAMHVDPPSPEWKQKARERVNKVLAPWHQRQAEAQRWLDEKIANEEAPRGDRRM